MSTNSTNNPKKLFKIRNAKDTNIFAFLNSVHHLKPINKRLVVILSNRFGIMPDTMVLLINIAVKKGGIYEN